MQLLLTATAHRRVRSDLDALATQPDIITVPAPDQFERAGVTVAKDLVTAEITWISFDAFVDGLFPTLSDRILGGRTKWIQTVSAGLDLPLYANAMAKGVRVTKGRAQAVPIAEYILAHGLSLLLPLSKQADLQARKEWQITPYREVTASHWLLIGFGSIGEQVASRLKPFGAQLTAVRRSAAANSLAHRVIGPDKMASALPDADVVVLACALTHETRGLADDRFFSALKPGSILINVGRGALINEDALRFGLERDQPAHAVLDVFATEPLPISHWAWNHPKIRVTAHTSAKGLTTESRQDREFLDNLRRYLAGEALGNEASPHEVGL